MANVNAKASRRSKSESRWAYLMVAPTVIGLLVLNIYPFLDTIKLSFSKTRPFGLYELQGLENYIEMFASAEFWRANLNTLYFCVLTVPIGLFLSLIVAVMLNAKIKGRTAFRAEKTGWRVFRTEKAAWTALRADEPGRTALRGKETGKGLRRWPPSWESSSSFCPPFSLSGSIFMWKTSTWREIFITRPRKSFRW